MNEHSAQWQLVFFLLSNTQKLKVSNNVFAFVSVRECVSVSKLAKYISWTARWNSILIKLSESNL